MATTKKETTEITSLNQWIDRYGITKYRDKEYEDLMENSEAFGATLANSTIDRLLKNKNLTKGSSGRS
jgi:hypothetical protein